MFFLLFIKTGDKKTKMIIAFNYRYSGAIQLSWFGIFIVVHVLF